MIKEINPVRGVYGEQDESAGGGKLTAVETEELSELLDRISQGDSDAFIRLNEIGGVSFMIQKGLEDTARDSVCNGDGTKTELGN